MINEYSITPTDALRYRDIAERLIQDIKIRSENFDPTDVLPDMTEDWRNKEITISSHRLAKETKGDVRVDPPTP